MLLGGGRQLFQADFFSGKVFFHSEKIRFGNDPLHLVQIQVTEPFAVFLRFPLISGQVHEELLFLCFGGIPIFEILLQFFHIQILCRKPVQLLYDHAFQ